MLISSNHSISVTNFIEFLNLEANAIHQAAQRLDTSEIARSLNLLNHCQGTIVISGVGKSGIVAKKIAATLTSIGTAAVFLHPCDALHGDLGIVTSADVALLLSNSGETQELVEMVPHLKRRQVPILAVLGNLKSTLAKQADVILDATVDREVCPLNLAPTTSTTVALAIGDALAMALMQARGITPEDFAVNHPAGRLGKRLTLKVGDLMLGGLEHPFLNPSATWVEVVSSITHGGAGAVNIVDSNHQLLGLITDGDLRRWMQKFLSHNLETLTAEKIMTQDPVVVTTDTLAYDALKLMENRQSQISVLPVVDQTNHAIGLIRLHDLLRNGL